MRKTILFLMVITLFVSACGRDNELAQAPDPVDAYLLVIDKLYEEDPALNDGIEYLAIDTSTMVNLNEESRDILLEELKNYGFTVLDMTYEELEKDSQSASLLYQFNC